MKGHQVLSPKGLEVKKSLGTALGNNKDARAKAQETLRERFATDPDFKEATKKKQIETRAKNDYPPAPKPHSSPY